MKTTHRGYAEEAGDFARLCRLFVELRGHDWRSTTWCLGRVVDWKYGLFSAKLARPDFCARNAELWLDPFGDLVGLLVSESGGADIAIATLPGYRFLYAEILAWALEAWAERGPRLSTEVSEHQAIEIRALEGQGFRLSQPYMAHRYDLATMADSAPRLDPGFTIVDMQAHPDYRARRILRWNGFHDADYASEQELQAALEIDHYWLSSPIYHPAADICVMAADGRFVAGCEALLDARNLGADIERVCTHGDFRRRGFARAAILACMGRLREMGMRHAFITGYSAAAIGLYGALGPAETHRCLIFEQAA